MQFNDCLETCQLDNLHAYGCEFSWTNKHQDGTRVWSRLDRSLVNANWLAAFPSSTVHVVLPGISDHSPLLVKVFEDTHCQRMFSFLNCWIAHSQFLPTVKNSWSVSVKGSAMFKIFRKLSLLRNGLKSLLQEGFSQLPARVKQAWVDLQECQQQLQTAPSGNTLMAQETSLLATYKTLKAAELSMIAQRRQQSIVGHITDHHGNVVQGVAAVNAAFVNYYKELLGEKQEVQPLDKEFIASGACLTEANQHSLCAAVTNEEIKAALFSIESTKSPGHDGYSAGFFKSTWQVIGEDFMEAVRSYFRTGKLLKQANVTVLTLIPKKSVVTTVRDFRPIACCTVLYKTISKILVTRMKPYLPHLVGQE
ncbi:uncharacterized protein LOC141617408 [Silene latifolia]|uniref:uncharacterized protein LOC141617408 n=1 Tax=Silene latifolia TaxID=37657 RepID=UPI003D76B426